MTNSARAKNVLERRKDFPPHRKARLNRISRLYKQNLQDMLVACSAGKKCLHHQLAKREHRIDAIQTRQMRRYGVFLSGLCPLGGRGKDCESCSGRYVRRDKYYKEITSPTQVRPGDVAHKCEVINDNRKGEESVL